MKIIAAILLTMLMVQDKPATQETAKQTAPATEQKTEQNAPVVLPDAKPVQVKIADGSVPQVAPAQPITIRMKTGDGETKELRLSAEQLQQIASDKLAQTSSDAPQIVVENGAVYIKTASFTIPMSGGGASGCLGEASRGKITFRDPAIQKIVESEKPATTDKK